MTYILSVLILVPLSGAVIAWVAGTSPRLTKVVALAFSLVETALATFLLLGFINPGWGVFFGTPTATPPPTAGAYVPLYYLERYSGWSQFGFNYIVGVDGLSVPLIWLTTLLTTLAIVFHWDQEDRPQAFFGLFLFLEMTLVGVFMALPLLFCAFLWDLIITRLFFVIGMWGGRTRRYAALKFLIFTQVGFVIMLLSIFALYFNSAGVNAAVYGTNANTLDMTAFLHAALRHQTGALATYLTVGLQIPMFAAFLVGFLVKLPSFPFHTWLPDAHVEAPTGGSVLLAGVLLKMGGYGIFRINFGILPDAARNLWWVLAVLGTVSMVYAAFVCLAQVDLKRLIAYSSIGHMGFVLLGASSLTVIGVQGGIFQMFNHGIITAILFMLAGSVKHATGTRDIPELQGLAKVMPQFSLILAIGFFASLGLPGLNSFWSEFMVFVGAYGSPNLGEMRRLIIIPLISIVVTAAYYVYTMQRILFGDVPEKLGHSHDIPLDECDLAPDDDDGGKPHVLRGREDPVGPVPQHQLHPRGRRALRGPRVPERAADAACPRDLLGRAPPRARVLRAVPVHGDDDQRRLPLPRPLPVLRLLGGRPDPDVFPHRGVGRAAQEVRRDQVLHVHVPREPPAAGGHLRILLLLESAHVRHDADHRYDADPRRDDRGPDVRRPPNRVRHETPDVAVAHMAARRPRRGSHGRLRHPGRSPPEARRLRVDPLQRPDDSAGRGRHVLAPRPGRGHLDPLRHGRVPRPGRPEAARRVLEREPHGVRDPRDRRGRLRLHGERPRRGPRLLGCDLPDVRPRPRLRGPVHGRGLARPQDRYPEHLGARRDREAGAAHGDIHHDLLHGVPRPPRARRIRRGVHRVHRRLRGIRPACFRSDPDGRLDGGVLHLGDAARDLRPSESEMGDDAGPASVRGRTARGPRGVVRRLRNRAGFVPLLPIELGPGDSRRPLSCPATASSSRRRSSSPRPSPPRSSASRGGSAPTCSGPSLSSARAWRFSSRST